MNFADALESYLIPTTEAANQFFKDIFGTDYRIKYTAKLAKVNGKSYNLSELQSIDQLMSIVAADKWSEADFVKFSETYFTVGNDTPEFYFEDPKYPEEAAKNIKTYAKYKMIPLCVDHCGNFLCYSKAKHGFYFLDHEGGIDPSNPYAMNISWKVAIQEFKNGTIATEGLGLIMVGIPLAVAAITMVGLKVKAKKRAKRLKNLTPGEQESLNTYRKSWSPAFKKYLDFAQNEITKQGFADIFDFWGSEQDLYDDFCDYMIAELSYEKVDPYYDEENENDSYHKLNEKVFNTTKFKTMINKLKAAAKKFEPYYTLRIDQINDGDELRCTLVLHCDHSDDDGIIKPGLPPFKG